MLLRAAAHSPPPRTRVRAAPWLPCCCSQAQARRPPPQAHGVRQASGTSVGLVGLPNVGKSTLFNGLVRAQTAVASNRPFTTIEPNVASVPLPDARLPALRRAAGSARALGWSVDVHDIAGLIRGASAGAGLGNAFLADIRACAALVQVVRCFAAHEVVHVEATVDPLRDIAILEAELLLADLQSVERRLERKPAARAGAAGLAAHALLRRALEALADGQPARVLAPTLSRDEAALWPTLQLLTQKPCLYVCNVSEEDLRLGGNAMSADVRAMLAERAPPPAPAAAAVAAAAAAAPPPPAAADMLVVSAQVEAEAALLDDSDRAAFLESYGLECTGLDAVVSRAATMLSLHSYYTVGPAEARSWCIRVGDTAVDAARAIHSDIADGFIRAEMCPADAYIAFRGEKAAREGKAYVSVGKDYIMRGGEVAVFRHAATGQGKKA